MEPKKAEEGKEEYEKPRLRTIELAAEEVMAVSCKTSFSDPNGIHRNGCLTGVCSQRLGS